MNESDYLPPGVKEPPLWRRFIREDLVGLVALAVIGRGVWLLWGEGWTLIVLGVPVFGLWVVRELLTLMGNWRRR